MALKRLIDPTRPITYGIVQAGPDYPGGVPYIRPFDMGEESGTSLERLNRTSPDIARAYRRSQIQPGDLIVSIGPSYGKVMVVSEELAGANLTQGTARLAVNRKVAAPHFVFWCLRSAGVRAFWDATSGGATFSALNLRPLGETPTPLPPLPTQCAIANFLDGRTQGIDELIRKKERLIELLQEKRQALITQAVTKGIDPNVPMKESGVPWLGEIPVHWDIKRLKHVARLESGHTPSRTVPEHWTDDNQIPWVSLNDTKHLAANDYISDTAVQINELGLSNSSARLLPERVVVFTRDATIGEAAITTRPMAVSQHIIAWVCGTGLLPEYLLRVFAVMRGELERRTMGATLKTIGMPDVRALVTPLPPLPEQEAIADFLGTRLSSLAATISAVTTQISLLLEYRQALISAAVTGQVDIPQVLPAGRAFGT